MACRRCGCVGTADLGVPGGIATLDENGNLNQAQIPADENVWVPLVLINGWAMIGAPYATPAYLIDGKTLYLRGPIKDGASGTVAFILPAEARSANDWLTDRLAGSTSDLGTAVFDAATGAVTVTRPGSYASFDAFVIRLDA